MLPLVIAAIVGAALGACLVLSIGKSMAEYSDPHDWEDDSDD